RAAALQWRSRRRWDTSLARFLQIDRSRMPSISLDTKPAPADSVRRKPFECSVFRVGCIRTNHFTSFSLWNQCFATPAEGPDDGILFTEHSQSYLFVVECRLCPAVSSV